MVLKYKKFFLLAFATIFGTGVILFAWKGNALTGANLSSDEGATPKSNLTESVWKNSLKVIPQDSFSRLFGASSGNKDVFQGDGATTATDLLGRELLTSYALVQNSIGKAMGETETEGIAGALADKVMTDDTKQYTEKDIVIILSNETASVEYVKEISQALDLFARKNTVKEFIVVAEAMDGNDASKLAPLSLSVTNLQQLLRTLLAIKVPQEATPLHLYLIQSYATTLSGIIDMQQIIADPARGMRGITKYKNGIDAIAALNAAILKVK